MAASSHQSWLDRVLRRIPIVGFLHRCLEEERAADLGLFVLNFVMATIVATLIWGWPAFIFVALATTFIIMATLVLVTRG